jgi:myo-inositol 2-dehydrogenase/D-chiro-inositol 1-dehydrogenase
VVGAHHTDTEFQRWVDAVRVGGTTQDYTDGPGAWDGYAAAAVCEAGVASLNSGLPVEVAMVDRASIDGA